MNVYPPKPIRGWPDTKLHKRLIKDDEWIVEPKINGYRCIVRNGVCYSRRGTPINTSNMLRFELSKLKKKWSVIDGELQFTKNLWVFDTPDVDGALSTRREAMEAFFNEQRFQTICLVPWWKKQGAYKRALREGFEGVVFKNINHRYKFQMTEDNTISDWIKMRPAEDNWR